MNIDEIIELMKSRSSDLSDLNHTVLFDIDNVGKILVDATGN